MRRFLAEECFLDGTFFSAKKGGLKVGKTKRGKGSKLMVLVDGKGTPLGLHLDSASPAFTGLFGRYF